MNRLSVMLVCFMAVSISVTHPAWSQCCAGAQHRSSDSFDGRFRVKGESLTPLGHHGPYHFKFRFLERANSGDYRELESFEMKWNVTDHFNMELMVSPLGNGFAVDFPDGCLTFYSRDGRQLFQLDSDHRLDKKDENDPQRAMESHILNHRDFELDVDGYNVHILKTVWFGSGGMHADDSTLFLPLGLEATDLLDAQVIWYLQRNPDFKRYEEGLVLEALGKVTAKLDPSEEETNELLKYGFMAITMIEDASKQTSDERVRARLIKMRKVLEPWVKASVESGLRDLDLIASMLFYPDSAIRKLARSRLEQLLQEPIEKMTVKELHDWVRANKDRLVWDATTVQYVSTVQ